MNQGELVKALSKRFFLSQSEALEIIRFTLSEMTQDLKKGERVYFRGFGSLHRRRLESKRLRHPVTGEMMEVPARNTVDFEPAEDLLEEIN